MTWNYTIVYLCDCKGYTTVPSIKRDDVPSEMDKVVAFICTSATFED